MKTAGDLSVFDKQIFISSGANIYRDTIYNIFLDFYI